MPSSQGSTTHIYSSMASLRRPSFNHKARVQVLWHQASAPAEVSLSKILNHHRLHTVDDVVTLWNTELPFSGSIPRSQSRARLTARFIFQNYLLSHSLSSWPPQTFDSNIGNIERKWSSLFVSFADHTDHHRLWGQNPKDLGWEAVSRHFCSDWSVLLRFACSGYTLLYSLLITAALNSVQL